MTMQEAILSGLAVKCRTKADLVFALTELDESGFRLSDLCRGLMEYRASQTVYRTFRVIYCPNVTEDGKRYCDDGILDLYATDHALRTCVRYEELTKTDRHPDELQSELDLSALLGGDTP